MTRREFGFCDELADLICWPQGMEIGGCASAMRDAIRCLTRKSNKYRNEVIEILEYNIEEGDYNKDVFQTDGL